MGWVRYTAMVRNLDMYLVDGYLPPRNVLEQSAELSAKAPGLGRYSKAHIPYSWDKHDEDSIYEKLAFNTRQTYCACRPKGKRHSRWSEAWLINPDNEWPSEFELKEESQGRSCRRLLVTLYEDCDFGQKCLRNLVKKSRFEVIPTGEYQDSEAFVHKAEALLEEISLPFLAPCIIAGEKIEANGYNYRAFGK